MNPHCTTAELESALAGTLLIQDEKSLHDHLASCEQCTAALEQLAGGASWQQQAAKMLAEDELDAVTLGGDHWSEVDFTVEHLEPADEPNLLGRMGGYDVLEVIGRGGMGIVLKGFDRELKRTVAIKVLAPHLAHSPLAKKRFAREAQAAAAVVHPHVLAIHHVQASGRLPFLVMPLVAGQSLSERLAVQGVLELKEILRIGMQAAAGLAAAHEQGLVHRDVKPANILLEKGVERAVLTDFGLARAADDVTLTRWGVVAGTPQYMSPEQVRAEPLDGRSDLFSLGCVLYEMATGISPFRTDSVIATMRRLVDEVPKAMASLNPELPPWFISIVERLLAKDPGQRFSTAQEVSELLEGCLAHVQRPATVPLPTGLAPSMSRTKNRRRGSRIVKGLGMIATFVVGVFGLFLASTMPPDIGGRWSGDEWGEVFLKRTGDGAYTGTYSDTFGGEPGNIRLKWSRIERRFNGTWNEGTDRFGEISVRLSGNEIRGAQTTDLQSRINPATPRLSDLSWRRVVAEDNDKRLSSAIDPATGDPMLEDDGNSGSSSKAWRNALDHVAGGDLARLQGTWKGQTRSGDDEVTVRLTIDGSTFTETRSSKSEGALTTQGRIQLDESTDPKQLNMKGWSMSSSADPVAGSIPAEFNAISVWRAIYKLDDQGFTMRGNLMDRPTEFNDKDTSQITFDRHELRVRSSTERRIPGVSWGGFEPGSSGETREHNGQAIDLEKLLVGTWNGQASLYEERYSFRADGKFSHESTVDGRIISDGIWEFDGRTSSLILNATRSDGQQPPTRFTKILKVVDFGPDWLTFEDPRSPNIFIRAQPQDLSCELYPAKQHWGAGESPTLICKINNTATKSRYTRLTQAFHRMEVDGSPYICNEDVTPDTTSIAAGGAVELRFTLAESDWTPLWPVDYQKNKRLRLSPGKHSVRVCIFAGDERSLTDPYAGPLIQVWSNPVEIEIAADGQNADVRP